MKSNAESDKEGSAQERDGLSAEEQDSDDSSLAEYTKQEDEKVSPETAPEAPVKLSTVKLSSPEVKSKGKDRKDEGAQEVSSSSQSSSAVQHSSLASERSAEKANEEGTSHSKENPPATKETKNDDRKAAAAAQPPEPAGDATYPNPKSFAERLMKFLELDVAPDCLWWVGGGKGVALHTRRLKEGDILATHFKVIQYSGFIRNLNRWGFRRVAHFNVGEGAVAYQNALFQKDEPHLVKHMRMDSDVQDVFERHQLSGESIPAGAKKRKAGTDRRAASKRAANQALGIDATERSSSPGETLRSPRPAGTKEDLLRQIMTLTEQFLNHPGALALNDASFNSLFQVVYSQGIQHHQGRLLGQTPYPPAAASLVANPALTALAHFQPPQQSFERSILSRPIPPPGYPNSNNILDTLLRNREATQQQQQLNQHLQRPDPSSHLLMGQLGLHQQQQAQQFSGYPPEPAGETSEDLSESKEAHQQNITRESSGGSRPRREYATADDLLRRMMRNRER